MDEDVDLKNGIVIQMDKFDFMVVMEFAEGITGQEAESLLKERGKHHNLICIWCL
jgi:hypothetical protein